MIKYIRNIIFLSLFLTLQNIFSQQYYFKNYTGEDGLSQHSANVIIQDSDGYLWVGTQNGLNRFNGRKFQIFSIEDGLENDYINDIAQDSSGTIWIATNNGVSRWDDPGFTNFNDLAGLANENVLKLIVDMNGFLWCSTLSGLYRKNENTFKKYSFQDRIPETRINNLFFDNNDNLWIATSNGLYVNNNNLFSDSLISPADMLNVLSIVQDNSNRFWLGLKNQIRVYKNGHLIRTFEKDDHINGPVNHLFISDNDIVWAATNYGVVMINGEKTDLIYEKQGLPLNTVLTVTEDNDKVIWLGGYGGVTKFQSRAFVNFNTRDGLGANQIRPIARRKGGKLWVGTTGGLNSFDGEEWKLFTEQDGLLNSKVNCLFLDPSNILWIGTENGLNYYDGTKLRVAHDISLREPIRYLDQYMDNIIIVCQDAVYSYNRFSNDLDKIEVPGNSLINARTLGDRKGNLWISGTAGLSVFNGITWKTYTVKEGLATNYPYFICEDFYGAIWFGYHSSHGLTRFKNGNFKTYVTKDGLTSNAVYSLGTDFDNNLWIGTARGVDKFDGNNFKNYNTSDGYASYESNSGGFFLDYDSTIWFGTGNGLSHYYPSFDIDNKSPPVIKINYTQLGDSVYTRNSSIQVKHDQKDFYAFIECLTYINEERIEFKYRLLGYSDRWKKFKDRVIQVSNLPPGTYTLEVKAKKYLGNWSKPERTKFIIEPPYWKTWWFRVLSFLLISTILFGIYNQRVRSIKRQNEKLELQVKERTKEVIKGKRETDNILNNVEEGLFLINPDYSIGTHYSKSLESILEKNNIACENFVATIQENIHKEDASTIMDFLDIMFMDDVEEEMTSTLSPLSKIKFHFPRQNSNEAINKFLSFKFKRIQNEAGNTEELISTVSDITNQIHLEKQLAETEEHQKKQMDWLFSILHVEPEMLSDFIDGVKRELATIDMSLSIPDDEIDISSTLQILYRSMHMIKGNAALLDLHFFVKEAHEFEDLISKIQKKQELVVSDLSPLHEKRNTMMEVLNEVNALIEKIGNLTNNFRPKKNLTNDQLIDSINKMVYSFSIESGKKVSFEYSKFDSKQIPPNYRIFIKEVLIQFVKTHLLMDLRIMMSKRHMENRLMEKLKYHLA
ncbi:MAG: hypothetical protein D8M58_04495 [Calditrichaeota bacterium]|nr:MAG: hypothetical protein DWQ03_02580 [Calditrichota bacterium]MBL1204630.1 hypothetical protein [Calditrichota bacterium]NOG44459.1 hypothetical protein [Calditrichota bacterium]